MSVAGAFADAAPVIAKETPAAAQRGKAAFERFRLSSCFAFVVIAEPLCLNSTEEPAAHALRSLFVVILFRSSADRRGVGQLGDVVGDTPRGPSTRRTPPASS
jgi:hypothetical protein